MRYDLIVSLLVSSLVAILMPLALAFVLKRRWGTSAWLFVAGALGFVASQIIHIPLLMGATAVFAHGGPLEPPPGWSLFNPLFLGLAAGICEEPARFITFRYLLRKEPQRSRDGALMVGAGHGGIESILLVGLAVPLSLINALVMREMSAEQLAQLGGGSVDAHSAQLAVDQIAQFWATPWWLPALSVWERAMAIGFHVSMSALVAFGVRKRALWPLGLAIFLHAALDAIAVYGAGKWNPIILELAVLAFVAPVSAITLFTTWRASPPTLAAALPAAETAAG